MSSLCDVSFGLCLRDAALVALWRTTDTLDGAVPADCDGLFTRSMDHGRYDVGGGA